MQLGQRLARSGYKVGQKLGQGARMVGHKLIPHVINYGIHHIANGVKNKVIKSILER